MFSFKCTKHLVDTKILKSGVVDQRKVRHSNEEELEVTKIQAEMEYRDTEAKISHFNMHLVSLLPKL